MCALCSSNTGSSTECRLKLLQLQLQLQLELPLSRSFSLPSYTSSCLCFSVLLAVPFSSPNFNIALY
jgi:hypothetical protein